MAYSSENFKTKKAFKDAVKAGSRITVYQPNGDLFGVKIPQNGVTHCEGPHAPQPHKWYAEVTLKDGLVVAVK